MTQFALLKINKKNFVNNDLVKLSEMNNEFLEGVAQKLLPKYNFNEIYCLQIGYLDFDQLLLTAQKELNLGKKFIQTDLAKLLISISDWIDIIFCWYGSDYDNLDKVNTINNLVEELELSAKSSSAEAYISFSRSKG